MDLVTNSRVLKLIWNSHFNIVAPLITLEWLSLCDSGHFCSSFTSKILSIASCCSEGLVFIVKRIRTI